MSASRKMGSSKHIRLNGNVDGGGKLQGIVSSVGKSYGENQNVVFYMNQLGYIGKSRSNFITGANGVNTVMNIRVINPEPEPEPEPDPEPEPEPDPDPEQTFTVTNSGSGAFVIDDNINPSLYLTRGDTYTFNIIAPGHPVWIQHDTPYNSSSIYSFGITNNGISNGTLTFAVPTDAPDTLYYVCQFHSSMQGTISIV